MNIIQPGDHVVIVIPSASSSPAMSDHLRARIAELPDSLGAVSPFTVTWTAIGAMDSDPYVLFVVRNDASSSPV